VSSLEDAATAVVQQFLEAVNTQRMDLIPQVHVYGGSLGEFHQRDQLLQAIGPLFAAFPDLRIDPLLILADGEHVVVHLSWQATHQGAFFGIAPTGKRVTVTGTNIYRMSGGRIVEQWIQEDLFGLMRQLGGIPASEAVPAYAR
jgi:predicted ester cyclase